MVEGKVVVLVAVVVMVTVVGCYFYGVSYLVVLEVKVELVVMIVE